MSESVSEADSDTDMGIFLTSDTDSDTDSGKGLTSDSDLGSDIDMSENLGHGFGLGHDFGHDIQNGPWIPIFPAPGFISFQFFINRKLCSFE